MQTTNSPKPYGWAEAVEAAKIYVTEAIKAADELHVGSGHGPVHHFYRIWGQG